MKSKQLREERAVIAEQIKTLVATAKKEDRALTSEEQVMFDRMDKEQLGLLERAEGYERMEKFEAVAKEHHDTKAIVSSPKTHSRSTDIDNAFRGWLGYHSKGGDFLATRYQDSADRLGFNYAKSNYSFKLATDAPKTFMETRGTDPQSSVTSNLGAEWVPSTMARFIEVALLAYSQVRQYARVIRTDSGATFTIPTCDDTSNESAIVAQNTNDTVIDLATDDISLASFMYRTGIVKIPLQWERDAVISVVPFVAEQLAVRHARGTNAALTTGNGSTEPEGFVTGSSAGKTLASVSAVTYAEMLDLYYSVPAAYRNTPNFAFVGSDTFAKALRSQVDGAQRPLWEPSLQVGQPDRYLGKPFVTNYHMDAMGTGQYAKKVCVAGDFNQFLIRDVGTFDVAIARERYIEYLQTGVMGFGAIDSAVLNDNALKYAITPAS